MKTEQIIESLRGFKNRLLLRLGYTLYNTQGHNIVFLDTRTKEQINSSSRIKPCKMGDKNWVKFNPRIHKIYTKAQQKAWHTRLAQLHGAVQPKAKQVAEQNAS